MLSGQEQRSGPSQAGSSGAVRGRSSLVAVPQTAVCDWSGTQGLGPTSPRRVDLQGEPGAVWALTVRLLHLLRLPALRGRSQSRGSPPAVSRVADTGAGHKVPRRCRGLLSPAGTPLRPRCARPAGLRVPAGCYAPLPRQGAQEGDDEDEDVTDELGEREGSA